MSDTYLTLCDSCAERMEKKYELNEVPKSTLQDGHCAFCWKPGKVTQYRTVTVANFAARRARARKQEQQAEYGGRKDTRAHYKPGWREET